jgi:hypothetical protein
MNRKKIYIFLFLILVVSIKLFGQEDPWGGDPSDPGGDLPIPGILYFLVALLGIGIKKIYNNYRK